jgi:MFS family permease
VSGFAFWGYFGAVFAEATYRYHADASGMAILGASLSVPFISGSLLQGLVVDRWSPKWLMVIGFLIQLASVPVAWVGGSLVALYASAFLVGIAFATIEPARSALTALLVPEDMLTRANGVIAVAFECSLAVGPLGAGWLLKTSGVHSVYEAAVLIASLPILLLLWLPDVRQSGEQPGFSTHELRQGMATVRRIRELWVLLICTALGWALVNGFFVLEPLFVKGTLHRGEDSLLFLWGAHGLGALGGALVLAVSGRAARREAVFVCVGVAIVGLGIVIYTGVGLYSVALAAAALSGVGFAMFYPPMLALIQRVVPEEQRGRVTSVFVAAQESMGLASSFVILILGSFIVVRPTLVVSGALLSVAGILGLRVILAERAGEPSSPN